MDPPAKSRRPDDTPFKQQKLKAWQPILTPNWVIGTFAVIGLIFIPVGIVLKVSSDSVVEYRVQYDGEGQAEPPALLNGDNCALSSLSDGNQFDEAHSCTIQFDVTEDMSAPVYVYYELTNFYQNHRRYVQSKNDAQLRGDDLTSTSGCSPLESVTSKKVNSTFGEDLTGEEEQTPYPCGLAANSLFNDIILLDSNDFTMKQTGIAWQSDISNKFANPEGIDISTNDDNMYLWQNPNYNWIIQGFPNQEPVTGSGNLTAWTEPIDEYGVTNEHFIVWMRIAGLPNFRKLYGIIDQDISAGTTLQFNIRSNFVVSTFEGTKSLVISTTSWFGGRNPFLGIAYITVGTICLILAIVFFLKHKLSPRKLGDTRYLVWKHRQ